MQKSIELSNARSHSDGREHYADDMDTDMYSNLTDDEDFSEPMNHGNQNIMTIQSSSESKIIDPTPGLHSEFIQRFLFFMLKRLRHLLESNYVTSTYVFAIGSCLQLLLQSIRRKVNLENLSLSYVRNCSGQCLYSQQQSKSQGDPKFPIPQINCCFLKRFLSS